MVTHRYASLTSFSSLPRSFVSPRWWFHAPTAVLLLSELALHCTSCCLGASACTTARIPPVANMRLPPPFLLSQPCLRPCDAAPTVQVRAWCQSAWSCSAAGASAAAQPEQLVGGATSPTVRHVSPQPIGTFGVLRAAVEPRSARRSIHIRQIECPPLPAALSALLAVGGRSRRSASGAPFFASPGRACTTRQRNTHQIDRTTLQAHAAGPHVALARRPLSGRAQLGGRSRREWLEPSQTSLPVSAQSMRRGNGD
jgi:hypothetical protein